MIGLEIGTAIIPVSDHHRFGNRNNNGYEYIPQPVLLSKLSIVVTQNRVKICRPKVQYYDSYRKIRESISLFGIFLLLCTQKLQAAGKVASKSSRRTGKQHCVLCATIVIIDYDMAGNNRRLS